MALHRPVNGHSWRDASASRSTSVKGTISLGLASLASRVMPFVCIATRAWPSAIRAAASGRPSNWPRGSWGTVSWPSRSWWSWAFSDHRPVATDRPQHPTGLSPKIAQTLARHSDVRLTLGVYTHLGLHDQTAAIAALPPPPSGGEKPATGAAELRATGTEGRSDEHFSVPSLVPSGAQIGAQRPASDALRIAPDCTEGPQQREENGDPRIAASLDRTRRYSTGRRQSASPSTDGRAGRREVSPTGLEPVTFGSGDGVPSSRREARKLFCGQ